MKLWDKWSFHAKKYYLCAFKETNIMKLSIAFVLIAVLMGLGANYTAIDIDSPEDIVPESIVPITDPNVLYLPGDVCDVIVKEPLTQEALHSYINKCRENRPMRINIAYLSN